MFTSSCTGSSAHDTTETHKRATELYWIHFAKEGDDDVMSIDDSGSYIRTIYHKGDCAEYIEKTILENKDLSAYVFMMSDEAVT
jgi:hypothetical protein